MQASKGYNCMLCCFLDSTIFWEVFDHKLFYIYIFIDIFSFISHWIMASLLSFYSLCERCSTSRHRVNVNVYVFLSIASSRSLSLSCRCCCSLHAYYEKLLSSSKSSSSYAFIIPTFFSASNLVSIRVTFFINSSNKHRF